MININDLVVDDDPAAEAAACRAFVAQAPEGGVVPALQPYGPHRDETFIARWTVGTRSHIARRSFGMEDAREAIFVGRAAGYSEADIAAYLLRIYTF